MKDDYVNLRIKKTHLKKIARGGLALMTFGMSEVVYAVGWCLTDNIKNLFTQDNSTKIAKDDKD